MFGLFSLKILKPLDLEDLVDLEETDCVEEELFSFKSSSLALERVVLFEAGRPFLPGSVRCALDLVVRVVLGCISRGASSSFPVGEISILDVAD